VASRCWRGTNIRRAARFFLVPTFELVYRLFFCTDPMWRFVMAEMLRDADSTERHLSIVRRHIRLCNSMKGAAFLSTAIVSHYDRQKTTLAARDNAVETEENAQDDLELRGREGADLLRTTSERAKQHDRASPGDATHQKIFPEGGFGDFISSTGTVSSATSTIIAARIGELGADHSLASLGGEHTKQANAMDAAQKELDDAHRARKLAEAEDELAQAALRRAYEANWLDARKKFGKLIAERLFPRIRRRTNTDILDDGADNGGNTGGSPPAAPVG
jgi:hypothetical protein